MKSLRCRLGFHQSAIHWGGRSEFFAWCRFCGCGFDERRLKRLALGLGFALWGLCWMALGVLMTGCNRGRGPGGSYLDAECGKGRQVWEDTRGNYRECVPVLVGPECPPGHARWKHYSLNGFDLCVPLEQIGAGQ